jgi:predicted RNA-binding protein YlqC (UPF0109 family)
MRESKKMQVVADDTLPLENSDLLLEIARALVDSPSEVVVEERTPNGGGSSTLVLKVAKDDRGKLIGKGGATIGHIRGIFDRIAAADRTRLYIEVEDDNTGRRRRRANGRRAA